ncbi:MAG TPA: 3-hydroxyacyl-CoA dehydrogenase NAD-binding domain-containing protein [Bryocella sp.]|nr:3-hydroxyacyl-CoA dehydrogenase NAD-binding domain-containing protein [Bryocella sp.]
MHTSCPLRRLAVIGAGAAGRDLALRCVRAGFSVVLEDVMPSRLRSAHHAIASEASAGDLHLASTVEEAVRDADLAIDFVPDELESKLEIFSMLDRMAPPRTILCTPTSALSIADLASCTYRPHLCLGLRFPAPGSAELIHTSRTSPDTLSAVTSWLAAIGFAVTPLRDTAEASLSSN